MLILGIETATDVGSCALFDDAAQTIVAEISYTGTRRHGRQLVPAVRDLLELAPAKPADLSAIAVSAGPGSFTGLRIGVAAANTMGQALGLPVVAVPTLRALVERLPAAVRVLAVANAKRNEVYAAGFTRASASGEFFESLPAQSLGMEELLAAVLPAWHALSGAGPLVVTGDMAREVHPQAARILGDEVVLAPTSVRHPHASSVAERGARMLPRGNGAGTFSPVLPLYVQSPAPHAARWAARKTGAAAPAA